MARKKSRQAKLARKSQKHAKKERRQQRQLRGVGSPSLTLLSGLEEAEELLEEGDLEDAVEVLEELRKRYPRRSEVLSLLLEAYEGLQDMWSFQATCERMVALRADDENLWLALAASAVGNGQLATARRAFDHFLMQWPESLQADEARRGLTNLDGLLQHEFDKFDLPEDEGLELFLLHDEINLSLNLGRYEQLCQSAERLLGQCPTFTPALNNRSQAHFMLGRVDLAIADARRVLELAPDNFHALSNLSRFLFLSGRFEEARELAEQLKFVPSDSPDFFVKQTEALSYVSDWAGILATFHEVQNSGVLEHETDLGMLYHLAGVAAAELGQLKTAIKHWKRAVLFHSFAGLAQQNLDDLKLPIGERNGPWTFPITSWIPRAVMERLVSDIDRAGPKAENSAIRLRVRKFLKDHPYLERLLPVLLERGDIAAREFVIRVASISRLPSIMSALQEFAFGQRGPDQLRYQAAVRLVELEQLSPGTLKLWRDGKWQETIFTSFQITSEPKVQLPARLERLAREAFDAINIGEGADAERLLTQVLAELPNDPSMLFNYAVAIAIQGREEEALTRVRDIHEQFPDYLFARLRLAQDAAERRDFEAAHALLDPLLTRTRLHLSEYTGLCAAHIELLMAEGKEEGARSWLKMWRDVDPDNPKLMIYEERLSRRGLLSEFFRSE
jgi:tetratricopeptide (TPR) repeat protein